MPFPVIRLKSQADYYASQLKWFKENRLDPRFLRFAFTRSLAQRTAQDRTAISRSVPGLKAAATYAKLLCREMKKVEAVWPGLFYVPKDLGNVAKSSPNRTLLAHVELVRVRASGFGAIARTKGTHGHPLESKRLYFVSAMWPYLKWKKAKFPKNRAMVEDGGIWHWLSEWTRNMESVPMPDQHWHEKMLCQGGLTAKDLRHFVPMLKTEPAECGPVVLSEPIESWWQKQRAKPEQVSVMMGAAAGYIAWSRRLYAQKGLRVNVATPARDLGGRELPFVDVAAPAVAGYCRTSEQEVRRAWRQIKL